jgi:anti-sigma-K factor RskA
MKPMVDLIAKGKIAVAYDKGTRMVALRGSDMPDMPEGKVVQLWAIVDGKPVSLGLATKATEGNVVMAEIPVGTAEPQAFALSLEDGSAKTSPEGPVIAVGQVSL